MATIVTKLESNRYGISTIKKLLAMLKYDRQHIENMNYGRQY